VSCFARGCDGSGSDELSFTRRRERAIKDLLARSAPKIDEWVTRGLVGSLKIPLSWVNEAKVRLDLCCLVSVPWD